MGVQLLVWDDGCRFLILALELEEELGSLGERWGLAYGASCGVLPVRNLGRLRA